MSVKSPKLQNDRSCPGRYVLPLHLEICANSESVGGKAASLAKMSLHGIPVPDGYAVTVEAFRYFCDRNGIAITDEDDCVIARKAILAGAFPPDLEEEIAKVLHDLYSLSPEGFAVRSSAVGEDSSADSMAGQLQTYLFVPAEHVKERIKECWAAVFESRAAAYRGKRGIDVFSDMGVIIQKQIAPLCAGVLFSLDPCSRTADHLVVEWVNGVGEQLVSGQVTPERLFLNRKSPFVPEDMDEFLRQSLACVVELSMEAERLFGHPVDIEWCADASKVYILQSRPITTLLDGHATMYSNVNIGENYPQPLSPFTWSVVERFRTAYFRSLFDRFGLPESAIDEALPVIGNLMGVHGGIVYYNLSNWYEMMAMFPFGGIFRRFLDNYIGQHVPFKYNHRRSKLRIFMKRRYFYRQTRFWFNLAINYMTLEKQISLFEKEFDAARSKWRSIAPEDMSIEELEETLLSIMDFLESKWGRAALADFSAMVFPGLLDAVVTKWLVDAPEMTIARLLQGLTLKSAESLKLIWTIARQIEERPELRNLLIEGEHETLDSSLDAGLERSVEDFMEQFGGRCYHELMITSPTFEERTDLFWELVKGYMLSPDKNPMKQEQIEKENRERFTTECLNNIGQEKQPLLKMAQRLAFKKILHDAQLAIGLRERARLCQSLIYGELRRVALELGRRLVAKGYLGKHEDVFYLEANELHYLLEGKYLFPETIPAIIGIRKEAHLASDNNEPPEFFIIEKGDYLTVSDYAESSIDAVSAACSEKGGSDKTLRGLGVSRGIAKGRARVIMDPLGLSTDGKQLAPGDILVTRVTDPGWTPLFLIAGGLIIEKGGLLSHAAIVAREFGIPTVVGVQNASRIIDDGQMVTVNGNTGEIRLSAGGEEV